MKRITFLLFVMAAVLCGLNVHAAPAKAPMRSAIFSTLPDGYSRLGNTSIYYNVSQREAAGPGYQTGFSILGKIGNYYYSSTYEPNESHLFYTEYRPGAGFIAAFRVNDGAARYLNASTGTSGDGVMVTARIEPQGEVAALIIYTFVNNNNEAVSVDAGVWGDIMIGDNDQAPLERLNTSTGNTYGIKMKYSNNANTPLLCALFGEHLTGVSPADDYWFGFFSTNWHANELCGDYSNTVYNTSNKNYSQATYGPYYMQENGNYDCGLGFCWKDRTIEAGESIELSYLISVGEIDFEEPIIPDDPEPGQDIFTYNIEAFDCEAWNDLEAEHPIHIWGHYEHPYGQAGYLEYQVDDENTWHQLGELTSAADYEFNFNISFNPNRATNHVIAVRFNDGLDNYTDLEGLSWTDVRSIPVNGLDDRIYNGEPQIYQVTYGDNAVTLGEDGSYIYPGEYTFTFEGKFVENTIGVSETIFTIDKAPCQYQVVIPEDTEYDGQAHGATVTVPEGSGDVTITYRDLTSGDILTEAPTEIGHYMVIIEITEGEYYYGIPATEVGDFTIYSNDTGIDEIAINSEDNGAWYTIDGRRIAAPTQRGIYIHNGKKYVVK